MNEPKPNNNKYYRLLEKGEIIQEGDCAIGSYEMAELISLIGQISYQRDVLRPVQVDEWIEYAKQKPTKEDFEPTGAVAILRKNHEPIHVSQSWIENKEDNDDLDAVALWRKVTLPQSLTKPKSATIKLKARDGHVIQDHLTLLGDGTAKLACGDVISAESIDEFIRKREEVTSRKVKSVTKLTILLLTFLLSSCVIGRLDSDHLRVIPLSEVHRMDDKGFPIDCFQ